MRLKILDKIRYKFLGDFTFTGFQERILQNDKYWAKISHYVLDSEHLRNNLNVY